MVVTVFSFLFRAPVGARPKEREDGEGVAPTAPVAGQVVLVGSGEVVANDRRMAVLGPVRAEHRCLRGPGQSEDHQQGYKTDPIRDSAPWTVWQRPIRPGISAQLLSEGGGRCILDDARDLLHVG